MGETMARTSAKVCTIGMAAAMLSGCQSELKPSPFVINQYITAVTDGSGTVQGVLHNGPAPSPNGGPSNSVAGFAAMVTGGSAQHAITGAAAFTRVVVTIAGMDNYYELTLPSGAAAPVILRAATTTGNVSVPVSYAVGDAGTLGPYSSQNMRIIQVGTGDVQVSVSWSDSSDVDLHVIDPSGEEIYYGHPTSASGGTLDLDSNAACSRNSDNTFKSNENAVWPRGGGASGTYTIRLDYWSGCGVTLPTDYVVTVATAGSTPQVFTGNFSGAGDRGTAGSGTLITTFDF
jgi:uncharacterized protein YfaP (DUF2135 family)